MPTLSNYGGVSFVVASIVFVALLAYCTWKSEL